MYTEEVSDCCNLLYWSQAYLRRHGKKWVTESAILIMRESVFQHPGIFISSAVTTVFLQCLFQQQSLHVITREYPFITVQPEPASTKVAGNILHAMWLWKITTLNETVEALLIRFYWSLRSIFVQNEDLGFVCYFLTVVLYLLITSPSLFSVSL